MHREAEELLKSIAAYNKAHVGDSDDAETDAAFEMEHAALALLRVAAGSNREIACLMEQFDCSEAETYAK
jgi:hypothetical protein